MIFLAIVNVNISKLCNFHFNFHKDRNRDRDFGDRANALNILTAYDAFDISTLDAEGREVTARF